MTGRSVLAVAVCIVCFLMGYMCYVAVTLVADFFISETDSCANTVAVCSQEDPAR